MLKGSEEEKWKWERREEELSRQRSPGEEEVRMSSGDAEKSA